MSILCIECRGNLDENNFYREVRSKCKDCLNKKIKCHFCEKCYTKKWLSTQFDRDHANSTERSLNLSESNDDKQFNNDRTLIVGSSFSGNFLF